MSKLEAVEERLVKDWCEDNGVLFIKFTPFGDRGWPDRIAIFENGTHVWLEMKRKGKKPRKLQVFRMDQLSERGVNVHWADSADLAIELLEQYL